MVQIRVLATATPSLQKEKHIPPEDLGRSAEREDYRVPPFRSWLVARFGAGAASKRAQPLPSGIYSVVSDPRTNATCTHRFAKRSVERHASSRCIRFDDLD